MSENKDKNRANSFALAELIGGLVGLSSIFYAISYILAKGGENILLPVNTFLGFSALGFIFIPLFYLNKRK